MAALKDLNFLTKDVSDRFSSTTLLCYSILIIRMYHQYNFPGLLFRTKPLCVCNPVTARGMFTSL